MKASSACQSMPLNWNYGHWKSRFQATRKARRSVGPRSNAPGMLYRTDGAPMDQSSDPPRPERAARVGAVVRGLRGADRDVWGEYDETHSQEPVARVLQ